MSANTLTGLIPIIYRALNRVSRELCGGVQSIYKNTSVQGAAYGQTIRYPIVPAFGTPADVTPGAYSPDATGRTIAYGDMAIEAVKQVSFPFTGEEIGSLGENYMTVVEDSFAEAMRTHVNSIESYILTKAYKKASRAVGTAGTTPFASNTDTLSEARKILVDNGAPTTSLRAVIDTAAGDKMRKLDILKKANESGDNMYRTGVLGNLYGIEIAESAGVPLHTAGTGGTSYAVNLVAGYAIGSLSIALDGGSGTILAGDIFTNSQSGRDVNKYVVATALSGGSLTLNKPGIRAAWVNDDTTAVGAAYRANLVFDANAIHIVTRPPLLPPGGDMATDSVVVSDPISGLTFRVATYKQYHQQMIEVSVAYGGDVVKPEFVATILG